MGGCQNYGPFWGILNIRCRIITGTQKGTIILTTTHVRFRVEGLEGGIYYLFPDAWEDLQSKTPIMVPYTTIG